MLFSKRVLHQKIQQNNFSMQKITTMVATRQGNPFGMPSRAKSNRIL